MKPNAPLGEIEMRLRVVRSRIRRVQLQRAAMVVATVAIAGLFALMAVDYFLAPLPVWLRWGLFVTWLVAVLAAVRFGFTPVMKRIGLLQVARWLETRHPEMEERLSTVLELESRDGSGVSPELLASLVRAAELDAGTVDAVVEVKSARKGHRWGRPAVALAAAMVLAFAIWPGEASRLFVRAVVPFSDMGNAGAGRFSVTPGHLEVLAGDAVRIETSYDESQKNLDLWMEFEDGQKISQPMTNDSGKFHYVLDPAKSSFRYRVRAGREESDGYALTVWPLPELTNPGVTLDFPDYTGVPQQESELGNSVEAVVGTQVTLTGRSNTAVEAAWLDVAGKRVAVGNIESAAHGGRIQFSWPLTEGESGEAVVTLKHRLGREIETLRFPVVVLDDQQPEVVLVSPMQRELKVRPDEVLEMKYIVTEDFALAKLAVEVDTGGDQKAMLDQELPPRVGNSKPAVFRGSAMVVLGELRSRFPGANEIRLRVRAEDGRPSVVGGPGVGYSDWLKLGIEDGAESLTRQKLREQHEGTKRSLEETMRSVREARERMDWHREEIKKGDVNEKARKDLKEAAEKLAAAQEKLDELAKQMKEGVHATKSDEVENAARMVAKAREELENAPMQDHAVERDERLQMARDEAEAAVKQLEEARNAMDRDGEKIEDLARLQELAQRQQEVARQAKENLARKADPKDWQEQQKSVGESIKRQLRERPDAKAAALKAQAEQAKILAKQAKEISDSQEMLEQQTKQVSEKSLQEAIAAEQSQIAKEANAELTAAREQRSQLADRLPAATSAAEAARDEIRKGDTQAAADSAKTAAQAMKEAAGKAEESPTESARGEALDQLAARQEQVGKAMETLAKGDSAEALKQLQNFAAENARALSKGIEEMPKLDGNGAMDEARNTANDGGRQAEAAAKEGQLGKREESAKQHDQSGQNFAKSSEALTRAAEEFSKTAAEAAGQSPNPQRAQVPPDVLAEAFQQASQASGNFRQAGAAAQAASAADALAQAAQAGIQQMQGQQAGQQGSPGSGEGEDTQDGPQMPEVDPGVPPELAKLGISAEDWEKIQANLKSDVGSGDGGAVPEEYRELVRGYFESMSKKSTQD